LHLGVDQGDPPVADPVRQDAGHVAIEERLVALPPRVVTGDERPARPRSLIRHDPIV